MLGYIFLVNDKLNNDGQTVIIKEVCTEEEYIFSYNGKLRYTHGEIVYFDLNYKILNYGQQECNKVSKMKRATPRQIKEYIRLEKLNIKYIEHKIEQAEFFIKKRKVKK